MPTVALDGLFTNDTLFKKLGLKIPQTFSQLLDVCRKAKAAGTVRVILAGAGLDDAAAADRGHRARDRVREGQAVGREAARPAR